MARKLHPHEERAFIKAAPQFEKHFRPNGCLAEKRNAVPDAPVDSKNTPFPGEMLNWDECSWLDEWGW